MPSRIIRFTRRRISLGVSQFVEQPSGCERALVVRTLEELGASASGLADLEETILIDDGKCSARSYRAADSWAMWLLGLGIVQFYDAQGNMLATVNLFEETDPLRMAA